MNLSATSSKLASVTMQGNRPGYILFILWPVVSFVHALFHLNYKSSRLVVIGFYALCSYFYPFSFTDNVDVVRHAERFLHVSQLPFNDFTERLATLYVSETNKPDILQSLIEFVVSRFTTDYRIYFAVLGAILGFFFYEFVRIMHKHYSHRKSLFAFLFIIFIFILFPPYRISGFRNCVALFVFLISSYSFFVEGDRRALLGIAATTLIHFGFFAIIPFFFICFIAGTRYWFYFILIAAAFALQDRASALIGDLGSELTGQFGYRVQGYTSDRYIEIISELKGNRNVFVDNQIRWTSYFFFALLILLMRRIKRADPGTQSLFALSLSLFAFQVFASNLETTFVRFSLLYIVLVSLILIRLITINHLRLSLLYRPLILGVMVFNLLIMTRKSIEFTGEQVIYPNLVLTFLMDTNDSVLDLIRK